jgi:hypothetical protein
VPSEAVTVQAYETVMDRLPPAAELQVGLDWHATPRLDLQVTAYNALNDERWTYDNADDLEPRLEITPSQFEAFRVYARRHLFILNQAFSKARPGATNGT